jgi:hypothetical protein
VERVFGGVEQTRCTRNRYLHGILLHHRHLDLLDLQGKVHIALLSCEHRITSKYRIIEEAKTNHLPIQPATFRSSHSASASYFPVHFPCVRDHFHLNLLRNPSTRHPTTSRRHNRYTSTSAFRPVHSPPNTVRRDTCSRDPAHKHLLDHRTSSPLDDPLVHIHPHTRARKLSQRA